MAETQTTSLKEVLAGQTREGALYRELGDGKVECFACGHRCAVGEGRDGICRVRFNRGGKLFVPHGYVGALQLALRSHGYYCGPVDGVFSPRVSEAIARMQKNFSLRVTGTLTTGVRRGLHLP